MNIPVNPNIDEFKEDFYKGLTLKQTVISCVSVGTGVIAFLFWYIFLGLPQSIALYLTLPEVFPIAASGFLKIKGMTLPEYFRKRRNVKQRYSFFYCPTFIAHAEDREIQANDRNKHGETENKKGIFLETENSIHCIEQIYDCVKRGDGI